MSLFVQKWDYGYGKSNAVLQWMMDVVVREDGRGEQVSRSTAGSFQDANATSSAHNHMGSAQAEGRI